VRVNPVRCFATSVGSLWSARFAGSAPHAEPPHRSERAASSQRRRDGIRILIRVNRRLSFSEAGRATNRPTRAPAASPGARALVRRVAMLLVWLSLAGCGHKPITQPGIDRPGRDAWPDYQTLVQQYNRHVDGVDRLWARAEVGVRFIDDDGRERSENFEDSRLIAVLPDRFYLALRKIVGGSFADLGANGRAYWLLDKRQGGTLYLGLYKPSAAHPAEPHRAHHIHTDKPEHASTASAASSSFSAPAPTNRRTELPFPIRPDRLPALMGWTPITTDTEPAPPQVEWVDGGFLIEPPGSGRRLILHPETGFPMRIDLYDAQGRSIAIARMGSPRPLTLDDGATARIASRVRIEAVDRPGHVDLTLRDITRDTERFNPRLFDLDRLLQSAGRVVEVDRVRP